MQETHSTYGEIENAEMISKCTEHRIQVEWIANTEDSESVWWCPAGHEIIELT